MAMYTREKSLCYQLQQKSYVPRATSTANLATLPVHVRRMKHGQGWRESVKVSGEDVDHKLESLHVASETFSVVLPMWVWPS